MLWALGPAAGRGSTLMKAAVTLCLVSIAKGSSVKPQISHQLQFSGHCMKPVTNHAECSTAGAQLVLGVASASTEAQENATRVPPFCFIEEGKLTFNADGASAGRCSPMLVCVCKAMPVSAFSPASPPAFADARRGSSTTLQPRM